MPSLQPAMVFVSYLLAAKGYVCRNAETGRGPADGEDVFQHLPVPEWRLHEDLRLTARRSFLKLPDGSLPPGPIHRQVTVKGKRLPVES